MSDPEPRRDQRDRADARPVYGSPGHRCDPLRPRRNPGRDRRPSGADPDQRSHPGRAGADRRPLRGDRGRHRQAGDRGAADRRRPEADLHRQPRLRVAAAERARAAPRAGVGRSGAARPGYSPARSIRPSWNGPGCGSRTRVRSSPCTGAAPRTSSRPQAWPRTSPGPLSGASWSRIGAARSWSCDRRSASTRVPRPNPCCSGRTRRRPSTPATIAPISMPSGRSTGSGPRGAWRRR